MLPSSPLGNASWTEEKKGSKRGCFSCAFWSFVAVGSWGEGEPAVLTDLVEAPGDGSSRRANDVAVGRPDSKQVLL